jgi:hypothetical protein
MFVGFLRETLSNLNIFVGTVSFEFRVTIPEQIVITKQTFHVGVIIVFCCRLHVVHLEKICMEVSSMFSKSLFCSNLSLNLRVTQLFMAGFNRIVLKGVDTKPQLIDNMQRYMLFTLHAETMLST